MIIDPIIGWFEIIEIPMFDLDEAMASNDAYIDKSYVQLSQFFNKPWIYRYSHPHRVMFDN